MCAGPDTNVQKIHEVQRDLQKKILNSFQKYTFTVQLFESVGEIRTYECAF